jgi:SAM-dependent methyltransferase
MSALREIDGCEVCGSTELHSALDLGLHPMCDDLVAIGDSRQCREYPIEILFCRHCRTAHQRFQIPKDELFPQSYHYRSRHTADVLSGMQALVAACRSQWGSLQGRKVLDIGCNDGSLLGFFRAEGAAGFGIEPTGAFEDARAAGHTVVHDYLSEPAARAFVAAHGRPDLITFTNVFAHIEDLRGVLRSLNLLRHPGTVIVIENHYLGAVLQRRQFDTFYHEHPRTYSYGSFARIAEDLGMQIACAEFPSRYGGNVRVFLETRPEGRKPVHHRFDEMQDAEAGFEAGLAQLAVDIGLWKARKRAQIEAAAQRHGPLLAKAFPGRSAIPVKLLGLDHRHIARVYEKPASAKIGHCVPGTRIPIVSDDRLLADLSPGAPILNLAWHIADEIKAYLEAQGYRGGFIDILSADDFRPQA